MQVSRASGCKILISLITFKVASIKTWAFNKIKDRDPRLKSKILFCLGLIARRAPQYALETWK